MTSELSRRHALTGAATVGLGVPLLAACGGEDSSNASDTSSTAGNGEESSGGAAGGGALAATADIEVGGGKVFADQRVVVVQPTEGEFKAFSSTCTHQGCQVSAVSGGEIHCPCHASAFSIEDGSVTGGPAPAPLDEVAITVNGDEITLA